MPCLLLTAPRSASAELRALDAGADAFVRKDEDLGRRPGAPGRGAARRAESRRAGTPAACSGRSGSWRSTTASPTCSELADALRDEGYDVVLAHSGEEALELLAVQPVDCILLDLLMPGIGGQETCRRIKAAPGVRDIPLIMLTALEDARRDDRGPRRRRRRLHREVERLRGAEGARAGPDPAQAVRGREPAHPRGAAAQELEAAEARAAQAAGRDPRGAGRGARAARTASSRRSATRFRTTCARRCAPSTASARRCSRITRPRSTPSGQDYLRRVRAAAQRMGELIDDLLELSRVGRGGARAASDDLSALARKVLVELAKRESPIAGSSVRDRGRA